MSALAATLARLGAATTGLPTWAGSSHPDTPGSVDGPDGPAPVLPLFLAAQFGATEDVQTLLAAKATPDCVVDPWADHTALYVAAGNGHVEVVRQLIAAKANPARRVPWTGDTALTFASWNGEEEVVSVLLEAQEAGAAARLLNNNQRHDATPAVFLAAEQGHTGVVRLLLGAKARSDERDSHEGSTPLVVAAGNGHAACVEALLRANASPALTARDGETAVLSAARAGHARVLEVLCAAKAAVDTPGRDGTTPLQAAATGGHIRAVRALLAGDCSPGGDANARLALAAVSRALAQARVDAGRVPVEGDGGSTLPPVATATVAAAGGGAEGGNEGVELSSQAFALVAKYKHAKWSPRQAAAAAALARPEVALPILQQAALLRTDTTACNDVYPRVLAAVYVLTRLHNFKFNERVLAPMWRGGPTGATDSGNAAHSGHTAAPVMEVCKAVGLPGDAGRAAVRAALHYASGVELLPRGRGWSGLNDSGRFASAKGVARGFFLQGPAQWASLRSQRDTA